MATYIESITYMTELAISLDETAGSLADSMWV